MNAVIQDGALRYLCSLETTCDVTIICQHNVKLMAHKIVLGIGSALLQDILLDCHSCQNMTILLPQVSSKLISLVLDYVYNGSIIVSTENDYKDFLEVARMLKLHNIDTNRTATMDKAQYKKQQQNSSDDSDTAKAPTNLQIVNRDDSKDNLKNEPSDGEGATIPTRQFPPAVVRITHIRRVKEVRNKVLPSPWRARSPRHCVDWSYSHCWTRYSAGCMNRMNDSNNNNVALPEEQQPPRKPDNVNRHRAGLGEDVLSLTTAYHPAANTQEIQCEQDTRTSRLFNYEPKISTPNPVQAPPCHEAERYLEIQQTTTPKQSSKKMSISPRITTEDTKRPIPRNEPLDNCRRTQTINDDNVAQDGSSCSKVISNSRNEQHKRSKVHTCKECGKTFTQLRNYRYHRSVHDGSGEFATKCEECGKTFNDRGYLRSHMKIHKDKKEYACNVCPKRFNQRVAYNMHLRIHTGVKPHVCSTCGKSFSRKMLLKQHERVHTGEKPFVCPQCGKSFADRSNMMLHARLHTGEKPYSCNICQKSFTKKHHLKTHLNFHTGIKPYACTNCGLKFSQSSNMKTHYKKCFRNGGNDVQKKDGKITD